MSWKVIKFAPKNGQWLDLGHTGFGFTERGRWGVHTQTGEERWVDAHGNGLFDATHFDYPREPPTERRKYVEWLGSPGNPYFVEYDDNDERVFYDPKTGHRIEMERVEVMNQDGGPMTVLRRKAP